jgi:hypothetical protein
MCKFESGARYVPYVQQCARLAGIVNNMSSALHRRSKVSPLRARFGDDEVVLERGGP